MKLNFKRNEQGLIDGVNYVHNSDGSINWRAMVKSEHLFPNRGWFESRNQKIPSSIEGLEDNQLLIKLGGIKDLARLRGFKSVKYDVITCDSKYVSIKCGITWIPNFENEYETYYEDVANATISNTSDFAVKFLETIAANRAFVRSVRNYLNVFIVGSDEIDSSKKGTPAFIEEEKETSLPTAQNMLEKISLKTCEHDSFEEFKEFLRQLWKDNVFRNPEAENWNSYSDIPTKDARILISIIKDGPNKQ